MARRLTNHIMNDGSRCFLALRPSADRYAVRDHVRRLQGATLGEFVTDGFTEAWIDFWYAGHKFNINDSPGDYWFFVSDPSCSESILQAVADHFVRLLEPESR
jgi:hypothetical protein